MVNYDDVLLMMLLMMTY